MMRLDDVFSCEAKFHFQICMQHLYFYFTLGNCIIKVMPGGDKKKLY